jgi:phage N-6-adenine-methyltransferase
MAGHDYWHTPPGLFRLLDEEFGFALDAACSDANCLTTFGLTEERDALVAEWNYGGAVWCNPPYSKMSEFVHRAWIQSQEHKLTVVLLIPAYTDPGYWWDCIVPHADEIRFLRGRVSFLEHGQKKESARFPSVVVVFRYRAGEMRASPRVTWWDWKPAAKESWATPLLTSDIQDQIA